MDCIGDVFDGDLFIIDDIIYKCIDRDKYGVSISGLDEINGITTKFFFADDCDIIKKSR